MMTGIRSGHYYFFAFGRLVDVLADECSNNTDNEKSSNTDNEPSWLIAILFCISLLSQKKR